LALGNKERPENISVTENGAAENRSRPTKSADDGFLSRIDLLIRLGILLGVAAVLALYFLLDMNKVSAVTVVGTHNLEPSYIQKISGVTTENRYFLTIAPLVEKKIEEDPLIESAKVTLENANIVRIEVTEKKAIGYRYEDEPVILLADNTKAPLKSDYLNIVANLPMITGFYDEEQTRLLARGFENVDRSTIEQMSEVSQYALTYEDEAIRILMRNGGYFIGNYYNLYAVNQYDLIYSRLTDRSACIYGPEDGSYAYATTCPWQLEPEEKEYWYDEEGNVIVNRFGDKVVKHYYKERGGSYALDENGNRIVVPIDETGAYLTDTQFKEHYEKGWYKTGVLVIEEEEEEPSVEIGYEYDEEDEEGNQDGESD